MAPSENRISPTAHYTAYVWVKNQLSHPALGTERGRRMYQALRPFNAVWSRLASRSNLEEHLLARHRSLDDLVGESVLSGAVGQVVELAAGLSGRGLRLSRAFPKLTYVESDLPRMAVEKCARLDGAALRGPRHQVVALDALDSDPQSPLSLEGVCATLDPTVGTAIVTEGLLGYLPEDIVAGLWHRIGAVLRRFPTGAYFSDLYLADDVADSGAVRAFRLALGAFVRGKTHTQAKHQAEARRILGEAGFSNVQIHSLPGGWVRSLEARL